jgi:DNA-binding MarR family transcriptional regulator
VVDLQSRLTELAAAGYMESSPDADARLLLTRAGLVAYNRLFAARQERVERFLLGWKPEEQPDLLRLLSRFTHELASGDERPGRDLEPVHANA